MKDENINIKYQNKVNLIFIILNIGKHIINSVTNIINGYDDINKIYEIKPKTIVQIKLIIKSYDNFCLAITEAWSFVKSVPFVSSFNNSSNLFIIFL